MTTRAQRRAHLQNPTELSPCQASQKAFWDYIKKANNSETGITYPRIKQFLEECKVVTSQHHEPIVEYQKNAKFTISRERNSRFEPVYVTGDFTTTELPYNKIKAAQALEMELIMRHGPATEHHSAAEDRKEFYQARQMQREGTYGTASKDLKRKNSRTNYTYCSI